MQGYNYSYEDAEVKPLESGEYEAVISNADIRTTQTGKQYLNISFRVGNNFILEKIFREKDNPNVFNKTRVGKLLNAINYKEKVADDFALVQTLKNKNCIIAVVKEFDDYKGSEVNKIKFYKQSKLEQVEVQEENFSLDINEDDLPF